MGPVLGWRRCHAGMVPAAFFDPRILRRSLDFRVARRRHTQCTIESEGRMA